MMKCQYFVTIAWHSINLQDLDCKSKFEWAVIALGNYHLIFAEKQFTKNYKHSFSAKTFQPNTPETKLKIVFRDVILLRYFFNEVN